MTDDALHELATLVLTKPVGDYTRRERERLALLLSVLAGDLEKSALGSRETTSLTLYGVGV